MFGSGKTKMDEITGACKNSTSIIWSKYLSQKENSFWILVFCIVIL